MLDEAKEVLDLARKLNVSSNHIKCVADRLAKKGVSLHSVHISSDSPVFFLKVCWSLGGVILISFRVLCFYEYNSFILISFSVTKSYHSKKERKK